MSSSEQELRVVERAGEVLERGNELTARVVERGSQLRERAVDVAERAREAVSQAPKSRWAKLAGAGLALIRDRASGEPGSARGKVTYEVMSLGSGILGGALAGAIFNWIWRAVSHEEEAPEPTALDRNIREVLLASALQGAVFGLVKAALARITAKSYRQFTENDPNRW